LEEIKLKIRSNYYFSTPLILKKIYTLSNEVLGHGGNSVVFKCQSNLRDDNLAIKILTRTDTTSKRRFLQEAQILDEVSHDHLMPIIDHGEIELKQNDESIFQPYIIMECCEETLSKYLYNKWRELRYSNYINQFRGLASALQELHKKALHRDIKPENILIKNGKWILSDLGLATLIDQNQKLDLTNIGEKIGPIHWMSPEQCHIYLGNNCKIQAQSDVFQLASIFWAVVNFKHPKGIIINEDWTNSNHELKNVLIKALQHEPDRRYADGREFFLDLVKAIETG